MDALQSELWNEALLQLIQDYRETEIVTVTNEDAIGVMDYLFPLHNKTGKWLVYNTHFTAKDVKEIILNGSGITIVLKGH